MIGHRKFDRAMHIRHLEQAERHVAQGKRQIAEQEERVAHLAPSPHLLGWRPGHAGLLRRLRGHNVTEARKLLDNFYASQALFIQHRDQIRAEL